MWLLLNQTRLLAWKLKILVQLYCIHHPLIWENRASIPSLKPDDFVASAQVNPKTRSFGTQDMYPGKKNREISNKF